MRHVIQRGLSVDTLRASVPNRYRSQIPNNLPARSYAIVLFRNTREDVVLSTVVESALAEVDDLNETLVAIGGGFTFEGLELLRARKCIILTLSDFYWTDASYRAIRERRFR
jgi:hypothetical protein